MINVSHVSKEFTLGDETLSILNDITLSINEGEYVSILGQSGSGKSTLMYIIGLLDPPTKGSVTYNGIDTSTLTDAEISRLRNEYIGFVFQQFNLINKLTILENVVLPALYCRSTLTFDPFERARSLIQRFGIAHRAQSYPNKISGGEQQRTAIARALIMNPEIVLADEPTGNLDSKTGKKILDLIDELNKKDKKTIIVVTHEKEVAERTGRKIVIADGKIKK